MINGDEVLVRAIFVEEDIVTRCGRRETEMLVRLPRRLAEGRDWGFIESRSQAREVGGSGSDDSAAPADDLTTA